MQSQLEPANEPALFKLHRGADVLAVLSACKTAGWAILAQDYGPPDAFLVLTWYAAFACYVSLSLIKGKTCFVLQRHWLSLLSFLGSGACCVLAWMAHSCSDRIQTSWLDWVALALAFGLLSLSKSATAVDD